MPLQPTQKVMRSNLKMSLDSDAYYVKLTTSRPPLIRAG